MRPDFFSPRATILDCGASRTALGVFHRQGRRIICDHLAVETFPLTAVHEDNWLENTGAALSALRTRVKMAGPVVLVLPAHLVLTKFVRTPRVGPARREKVLRFEAGQNIPYQLAEVVWDSVVAGEGAEGLDVLLAAAKLEAVEPICAAVQAAGFELQQILPAALATLAAFRLKQPGQAETSLILNLGARSTTLLLVQPGRFAVRSLPLGGASITQQIAENQDCDAGEAEGIKLSERGAGLTADAMETFATRLTREIARSALHFRRQNDMAQPARIHLTGGGARLAGLAQALAARLKVPVEHLDAFGAIELAGGAAPADDPGEALALTDLAGAAATRLRSGQQGLNLLPPRWQERATLRRRLPWLVAAAALAVAALLPPALHYHVLAVVAGRKTAAIEQELVPLRERDARNRANLLQLAELRRQIGRLQDVRDRRASWLHLLVDLQERLGRVEDVWLEQLQVVPGTDGTLRLHLAGRLLDRTNPLARVSLGTSSRLNALLREIAVSPYVRVAEEGRRFDNSQPGVLQFEFVLAANPTQPL